MRAHRKKIKKNRTATIKPQVHSAASKHFEEGISPEDLSRLENEGGSSGSVPGLLAAEVYSQPDNPVSTPLIKS